VELLLQENALLLQQQTVLQSELSRMQGQLSAAAADNIRLAQQAAGTVQQLQGAAEAVRGSQQREQQLHGSLAAAVGQCETVGRELAALSGKLEATAAQCQELRWGGFVEWAVADCLPCMGLCLNFLCTCARHRPATAHC
jgi:hypothetical protein